MLKMMSVGEAALFLGVCVKTMHRWEADGYLMPSFRTVGNHRRYSYAQLQVFFEEPSDSGTTVLYARVSSHDQKNDLERQAQLLQTAACSKGYKLIVRL